MTQSMWIILYVLQHIVLGFGLGSLTFSLSLPIKLKGITRFMLGFCMTPFMISYIVSALGYILPGENLVLFRLAPSLAGLTFIAFFGKPLFVRLKLINLKEITSIFTKQPLRIFLLAIIAVNLLFTAWNLRDLYRQPIRERDALVYLNEALAFTETRDSRTAILGIRDHPDGSIIGNYHGFVFPGYLSNALMFADQPGPGQDQVAKYAFHILFLYAIAAIVLLGTELYSVESGLLGFLLLFPVMRYSTVLTKFSRDYFRIIPFVIIGILLLQADDVFIEKRVQPSSFAFYAILFIYAAVAVGSHSLGAVWVACSTCAWFLVRRWRKATFLPKIVFCAVLAFGTLVGSFRFIEAILLPEQVETGTQYFNFSPADEELEQNGTDPTFESFINIGIDKRYEKFSAMNAWQLTMEVLNRDKFRISLPTIIASLIIVVAMMVKYPWKRVKDFFLISLIFLFSYLPISGIFDISVFSISQLYLVNSRYLLHAYPFGAVLISSMLFFAFDRYAIFNGAAR